MGSPVEVAGYGHTEVLYVVNWLQYNSTELVERGLVRITFADGHDITLGRVKDHTPVRCPALQVSKVSLQLHLISATDIFGVDCFEIERFNAERCVLKHRLRNACMFICIFKVQMATVVCSLSEIHRCYGHKYRPIFSLPSLPQPQSFNIWPIKETHVGKFMEHDPKLYTKACTYRRFNGGIL